MGDHGGAGCVPGVDENDRRGSVMEFEKARGLLCLSGGHGLAIIKQTEKPKTIYHRGHEGAQRKTSSKTLYRGFARIPPMGKIGSSHDIADIGKTENHLPQGHEGAQRKTSNQNLYH
jgi:hypothetical protein